MQLVKERGGHWYRVRDNVCTSCHEWPRADGKGMKRTTLREAKEHHLWPSVTNVIDGVLAKPELINWRITQGIMAALTLPRIAGESEDAFALRVAEDMDAYSEEAKDFGTECHDHIAEYITKGEVIFNEAEPYTRSAREWISENVTRIHGTEMTVFHPELCVAGRLDLDCDVRKSGRTIIDFKSSRVRKKPNDEWNPVWYDEFPIQLAAYADCVRCLGFDSENSVIKTDLPNLISIIINSAEPSECFVKEYTDGEYYLRLFKHCVDLFAYKKGYDARTWIFHRRLKMEEHKPRLVVGPLLWGFEKPTTTKT